MENNSIDPKAINFKKEGICLRELDKGDDERIVEIIQNCAIMSTFVLYKEFVKDPVKIEKEIYDNDRSLQYLLEEFKDMNLRHQAPTVERRSNNVPQYIAELNTDKLFYSYGPISVPLDDSVNSYTNNAMEARQKPKRIFFRLGVEYGDTLIGCFVFDFEEHQIDGFQPAPIGDIGIFIDPKYREASEKDGTLGKRWHDVFSAGVELFKQIFNLYKCSDSLYISATTHPLNFETKNILNRKKGFIDLGIKRSKYGNEKRRYFVIEYNKFLESFKKQT